MCRVLCNVIHAATVNAMSNADIVYDPARAADLLGVSASGLRRLAPIYESVFGELKRVGKGDEEKRSREWPSEAVGRLQAARSVTGRGRPYRTIEAALEAIRDGVEVDTAEIDLGSRQAGADAAIGEALQVLIGEIQALRLEVAELKQDKDLQPLPEINNLPQRIEEPAAVENRQHGILVKLAMRLESLLNR
jgi:hypothetical protein